MTFYHFTSEEHLPLIVASGVLLPSESNVHPALEHHGPDVVWLLDVPSASGGGVLHHGLLDVKRRIRFEVDVPAIRWLDWLPAKAMDRRWKAILVDSGGGVEAASHWYVWPGPIRADRWRSVADTTTGEAVPYARVVAP